MGTKRKGLRNVRTAQKGGLRSLPRRVEDALNELAQLMRERDRLVGEGESCRERLKLINCRLGEIAEKESCLRGIAEPVKQAPAGSLRDKRILTLHY